MRTRKYSFYFILLILLSHIILVTTAGAVNKIMPLGDSITWDDRNFDARTDGEKVSYRYRLWQLFTNAGYEIDFVGSENTGFDIFPDAENEGHPGWTDDQIVNGRPGEPEKGNLAMWLAFEQPKIVLLHIGTNGIDPSPDDVEAILDEIDAFSPNVWVVLARIINRTCSLDPTPCPESQTTMDFNDNVEDMALDRINNPGPPALPDKIVIVDMEAGADIIYRLQPVGDMWDDLHPFETGYAKMADLWFTALMDILPQADAGPGQNVDEFDLVTLDASGSSDPKNGTLTYQWVQTAGTPTVVLSDAQAEQPTFNAPDAGLTGQTLTFTLTVTDEDGLESTDTVDITVAKIQPIADAGPGQTVHGSATVQLDGSGSVGVGLIYHWAQLTGTPVILSDNNAVQPTFVADVDPSGETLTFELTVTDDDGVESTDTVDIAVKILPQADAGPDQNVDEFDQVTLDASGSVAAGALSYQWTQAAGTAVGLSDAQAVQPSFVAPDVAPGSETLTFRLTVTDADNLESTDTVNVIVNNHTISDSGGGGGSGGGGCFISNAVYGSLKAPSGNTTLVVQPGMPVAALEFVIAMTVFICMCAAIVLQRRRKKRDKTAPKQMSEIGTKTAC